jgi:hypothetical protein
MHDDDDDDDGDDEKDFTFFKYNVVISPSCRKAVGTDLQHSIY